MPSYSPEPNHFDHRRPEVAVVVIGQSYDWTESGVENKDLGIPGFRLASGKSTLGFERDDAIDV